MTTTNKHYILAALLFSLPILVHFLRPTQKLADIKGELILEQAIPNQFADWHTDTSQISAVDSESGGGKVYDQVLSRTYVNSHNERIMLTIAYGSTQNHELKVHQQEVCYKAGGFEINQLTHKTLSLLNANIFLTQMYAVKGNRNEPVSYWFTIGSNIISDRFERNITVLKYLFSGYIADGYLIRISNLSNKPNQAFQQHEAFINDFLSNLPPDIAKRFLGQV